MFFFFGGGLGVFEIFSLSSFFFFWGGEGSWGWRKTLLTPWVANLLSLLGGIWTILVVNRQLFGFVGKSTRSVRIRRRNLICLVHPGIEP